MVCKASMTCKLTSATRRVRHEPTRSPCKATKRRQMRTEGARLAIRLTDKTEAAGPPSGPAARCLLLRSLSLSSARYFYSRRPCVPVVGVGPKAPHSLACTSAVYCAPTFEFWTFASKRSRRGALVLPERQVLPCAFLQTGLALSEKNQAGFLPVP